MGRHLNKQDLWFYFLIFVLFVVPVTVFATDYATYDFLASFAACCLSVLMNDVLSSITNTSTAKFPQTADNIAIQAEVHKVHSN